MTRFAVVAAALHRSVAIAVACLFVIGAPSQVEAQTTEPVEWTNRVGVGVTGSSTLVKTATSSAYDC